MKKSHYLISILTLIFGFASLSFDSLVNNLSVTPLFSLSWLMIHAFYQPKRIIFVLHMILLVCVVVSLRDQSTSMFYLRTMSFILGGSLAALFAGSREKSRELLDTTVRIIERLPALVVATDANGTIIAASEKLLDLVKDSYQPLIGHHFSDVFMGQYSPGNAIRICHDWMQQSVASDNEFILRHEKEIRLYGKPVISGAGNNKLLTAVFTLEQPKSFDFALNR
ncbi:MAG: PAS domain-containing protein [Akkermansiaceae bacterium]|nr:PAS domain-containing protein [Akkermansiaceae bacterium]